MSGRIIYSALGGGQTIGASCHYFEIDDKKILIDCGKGSRNGVVYGPDFMPIYNLRRLPGEIENIFISHAHFDHIGFFSDLFKLCGQHPIYTSRLTAELGKVLLWDNLDKNSLHCSNAQMQQYIEDFEKTYSTINVIEYSKPRNFGSYTVTFYEAGHIPGAAMIYIESDAGTVLYTGDFSMNKTTLTDGALVPDNLKADTVIIDGTFAKRPGYRSYSMLERSSLLGGIPQERPTVIRVNQLTKGIEILNIIKAKMDCGDIPQMKIFVDDNIWNVSTAFMNAGIQVLHDNCYLITPESISRREKGIFITTRPVSGYSFNELNIDFSLHAGFDDLKQFVQKHAERNVIVVHSPNPNGCGQTYSLERECGPKYNFIYPENGEIYQL